MTAPRYLLFNIGCIECGVTSDVVGVFESRELAEGYAQTLCRHADWRRGGQNDYEVFELPEPNVVNPEYLTYLEVKNG